MRDNNNLTARDLAHHIRSEARHFGMVLADGPGMAEARELASQLIGGEVVSTDTLDRVQSYTGCAVLVAREAGEVAGVLAFVLLNAAGARAARAGRFDVFNPATNHMASPDEIVCATYGWGVAASDKPTAKRIGAASEVVNRLMDGVPRYARAVTDAGRRFLCDRFGFRELPGSDGLVWLPPPSQRMPAEAA